MTVSELDQELVRLVLELVELELGAGASEVAVARVQALLEFHCFAPGVSTGINLMKLRITKQPIGKCTRTNRSFRDWDAPNIDRCAAWSSLRTRQATDQGAAAAGSGGPYGGLTGAGGRALSPGALLRLFDNFWESGAARVGEDGALGWASW